MFTDMARVFTITALQGLEFRKFPHAACQGLCPAVREIDIDISTAGRWSLAKER